MRRARNDRKRLGGAMKGRTRDQSIVVKYISKIRDCSREQERRSLTNTTTKMLTWRRRIVLRTCGWQVDPLGRWMLVWVDRWWKSTPWKGRVAWPWTSSSGIRVRRVGPRNVAEAVGWPRRSGRSALSIVVRIPGVDRSCLVGVSQRSYQHGRSWIGPVVYQLSRSLFDARFDCSAAHRASST